MTGPATGLPKPLVGKAPGRQGTCGGGPMRGSEALEGVVAAGEGVSWKIHPLFWKSSDKFSLAGEIQVAFATIATAAILFSTRNLR